MQMSLQRLDFLIDNNIKPMDDVDALPELKRQKREELLAAFIAMARTLGGNTYRYLPIDTEEETVKRVIGEAVSNANIAAHALIKGESFLVYEDGPHEQDYSEHFSLRPPVGFVYDEDYADVLIAKFREYTDERPTKIRDAIIPMLG